MPTCSMASGVQVWVEGVGSWAIQGAGWESNPIDFTARRPVRRFAVLSIVQYCPPPPRKGNHPASGRRSPSRERPLKAPPEKVPADLFDKPGRPWQNTLTVLVAVAMHRLRGQKARHSVIHLNCVDKALLAFEVNCTGQRIGYSGIFSVRGEPDPDRLRKAILSTARAHPKLMTTLCGGPLWHHRRKHEDFVGEVLEVQDLTAVQVHHDSAKAAIESPGEQRIREWINRPLDTRKVFPFRVLSAEEGTD